MTLFAKQRNDENNMITVGSRVKATAGQWHPNLQNYPSNTLLTGTVLKAVGKGYVVLLQSLCLTFVQ